MNKCLVALGATAIALSAGSLATAQSQDSITILHGIPGVTVDLVVDGEVVIAGFDAGDTQDLTPLAGTTLQNIEARSAGGDEVVIGPIESYDVPDGGNASVVVHLDPSGTPTITSFFNDGGPTEQGRGLFTVRHAAAAPPVDVSVDDTMLTGIGNGQEAGTVLPAGEIAGAWVTAGGERLAPLPTLLLEANTQLIVYVGGDASSGNLEFYQQVVSGGEIEETPEPAAAASGDTTESDDDEAAPQADDTAGTQADDAEVSEPDESAASRAGDDGTPQAAMVNTGDGRPIDDGPPIGTNTILALLALGLASLGARAALARSPSRR